MSIETERKWLLNKDRATDPVFWAWVSMEAIAVYNITQSYITHSGPVSVRIRHTVGRQFSYSRVSQIDQYVSCIKAPNAGDGSIEIEQVLSPEEGRQLMTYCDNEITKTRYVVPADFQKMGDTSNPVDLNWEIDVFKGRLAGLVLVEMEFPSSDTTIPFKPYFLGEDVTLNPQFKNAVMARQVPNIGIL